MERRPGRSKCFVIFGEEKGDGAKLLFRGIADFRDGLGWRGPGARVGLARGDLWRPEGEDSKHANPGEGLSSVAFLWQHGPSGALPRIPATFAQVDRSPAAPHQSLNLMAKKVDRSEVH
jgi:hypothetical protein